MRATPTPRTEGMRCISRVVIPDRHTRGWQVRVIRRGISINEFFSDRAFGGKAGALSEAMHFRDDIVRDLKPIPRSELARRLSPRNTSGIVGVRRTVKRTTHGGKVFEHEVWEASGTPQPGKRRLKVFSVARLGEDLAREAAITQRLRWESQMDRHDQTALGAKRR